jgi:sugar phosphate isomerase/epimerase
MHKHQFLALGLSLLSLAWAACGGAGEAETTDEMTEDTTEAEADTAPFGGLALYTLRDTMGKDPRGVLRAVADMGYAYIEAAGYQDGKFYGMEPTEFKDYLAEIGLQPMSSHNSGITLDNADQVIADVKAAGFRYLVIPIPPMGYFTVDRETRTMGMSGGPEEVMEAINLIADKCAAAGIQCLYHNHDFEFKETADGIVPIEYFLENSDPEKLNFQMDLFWVTKAGADPLAYFEQYPGRFKAWHVKDMDDEGRFAPVGEGTIDFSRILAQKEQSGLAFYLVEQDQTFNHTPLEAAAISHEGLKGYGFE